MCLGECVRARSPPPPQIKLTSLPSVTGRIWWGVPTNSFKKRSYTKLGEAKDRAVLAALNTTAVHASLWGSLAGPGSREEVELEGKYPLGWFAMQCAGPQAVPKLRYSAWAEWDVVRDLHHGYVTADYRLPSLNGKAGAGPHAISGPGYPNPGNDRGGQMARWHIWPGKLSNVQGLGNFTQWQPFDKETPVGADDKWAVSEKREGGGGGVGVGRRQCHHPEPCRAAASWWNFVGGV